MTSAPSFENYTLTQSALMSFEGQTQTSQQDNVVKITADKVKVSGTADGESMELTFEGVEATAQKGAYEQVFLALLDKFENFTYDEENDLYTNPETITVNVQMVSMGTPLNVQIAMQNGKVKLNDDGKLLSFVCDYKQTTATPDGTYVMNTVMNWAFSDYGTTVID